MPSTVSTPDPATRTILSHEVKPHIPIIYNPTSGGYDLLTTPGQGLVGSAGYVWDTGTLAWVKATQVSGGGGGGAATIADGADVALGATTDAAVTTNTTGTVSGKLRGIVAILASVWDSVNGRLKVDGSAVTQPVSDGGGSLTVDGTVGISGTVPVSDGGGSLTVDGTVGISGTVPVSAAALPLPSGAATESTLTGVLTTTAFQSRINTLGQKASTASTPVVLASDQSAVPINDNGGSLTVDGTVGISGTVAISAAALPLPTGAATEATLSGVLTTTAFQSRINTLGQKVAASSTPVVLASDQSSIPVSGPLTDAQYRAGLSASSPAAATVGTSSGSAVAANASRKGLILVNTSTATISLGLGAAAVLNSGITLKPNGSFNMGSFSLYTGQINAIASAAGSNLAIQEFV